MIAFGACVYKINSLYIISLFVAFIYSLFVQFGPLGFGIDVHDSYQYSETWPLGTEPIGWLIASFQFDFFGSKYFIGSALTSFLIAFGLFCFIFEILGNRFRTSYIVLIGTLLLFTHPVIFSSTNVLRQGIATGFFYLFLFYFYRENYKLSFFFSILSILSHNAIIILLMAFYIAMFSKSNALRNFLYFLYLFFVFILSKYILSFKSSIYSETNYTILIYIILSTYAMIFGLISRNYVKIKFTITENILKIIFFVNLLVISTLINSPSAVQRLLLILFIPMVLFMILALPLKKGGKSLTLFAVIAIWVFITISSSALNSWQSL